MIKISPETPASQSPWWHQSMNSPMQISSLRQGMTIETVGPSVALSATDGMRPPGATAVSNDDSDIGSPNGLPPQGLPLTRHNVSQVARRGSPRPCLWIIAADEQAVPQNPCRFRIRLERRREPRSHAPRGMLVLPLRGSATGLMTRSVGDDVPTRSVGTRFAVVSGQWLDCQTGDAATVSQYSHFGTLAIEEFRNCPYLTKHVGYLQASYDYDSRPNRPLTVGTFLPLR